MKSRKDELTWIGSLITIATITAVFFVINHESFMARASQGTLDFSVAAAGDWGCNSNTLKTISNIVKSDPALVIGLGDNSYQETGTCWLSTIKPFDSKIHTAFGNHDATPELIKEYLTYFKLTKPYYSFDFKNLHFIAIDTNAPLDQNSEQFRFVKSDLEKAASNKSIDWIIPFFHIPAYTTPSGERIETLLPTEFATVTSYDALRNAYQPLFDKYGVKIVLQAHAHNYQRTYPILYNSKNPTNPVVTSNNNETYNNPSGEIYLTVGTSGRDLHVFVGPAPPYIHTKQDTLHGFLSLQFSSNGSSVTGQFYANDLTKPIDQFNVTK